MSGIRLVIDEFRTDVTKTRKDGSRGKLRIDYGDSHQPEAAVKWLWRFVDGAKTAGELYGRALVVIAAEQYASRLVVPQSQRITTEQLGLAQGPCRQGAEEARRAAPAGVAAQLETAVKRAHEDGARAERAAAEGHEAGSTSTAEAERPAPAATPAEDEVAPEADVETPTTRTRGEPPAELNRVPGARGLGRRRPGCARRSAGPFPSRGWQPWRAAGGAGNGPAPARRPPATGGTRWPPRDDRPHRRASASSAAPSSASWWSPSIEQLRSSDGWQAYLNGPRALSQPTRARNVL